MPGSKIHSSIIGFDEIVGGGIAPGSMVLLKGPPFCGKKLFMMQFLFEQLKSSQKVLFILTDFSYEDFKTKMLNFKWDIEPFEKQQACFFIDAYSKQYFPQLLDSNTVKYISSPGALSELSLAVSKIQEEFSLKNFFIGLHSLSTILKSSNSKSFFNFLNFEIGKLKRLGSTALFTLEKNAQSIKEELAIEHLMDGVVEFENAKILVKGLETFENQWHDYSITEHGISIL
ncbi:MAG: RAD55 family ATPase [Candidatus Micrarchaeota archaeon]|nr:RAD55 family ATPase [Candidatus Micrarchaeota archaeon]